MAGDEYLGIELSNRLQRINGAVLVMRKVGRQQARSDTVERGMGGEQCVAGVSGCLCKRFVGSEAQDGQYGED